MIFCKKNDITIRNLNQFDKKYLNKWLSNQTILEYYGGRDSSYNEKTINEKFYVISDKTRRIIEYLGEPIGYLQFYPISNAEYCEYGYSDTNNNIYGTDQFIGEDKYWNKGIGTVVMKEIIYYLIENMNVNKIILDPHLKNKRAIACYKKCGFKKIKKLPKHELHEGILEDCWLMEYDISFKK